MSQPKQEIFQTLKSGLGKNSDFEAFLSQKISFDGRDWTAGQFLYKYFYDEFQPFGFYARDHRDTLTGKEKELADKLFELHEKGLANPKKANQFLEQGGSLDPFNGDKQKEAYYQNLFAGPERSVDGNPCYWHPVSRLQTAFIEHKLSQMGMTEEQTIALMTHCEKEREKAEAEALQTMPEQFVHNSPIPPEEMAEGKISLFTRSEDNFLNLQKLAFVDKPQSFHSGLPIQAKNDFALWPRFNPNIFVLQMGTEDAKKQIATSYDYMIDMSQKDAIRPCVPLWGGEPSEWVSVKPLDYTDVKAETLQDLMAQGKEFYLIPDKEDWKAFMENTGELSPEQAQKYMADLATQYPDRVLRLDKQFLADYKREFASHEAERKELRQKRIKSISTETPTTGVSIKEKLGTTSKPTTEHPAPSIETASAETVPAPVIPIGTEKTSPLKGSTPYIHNPRDPRN